MSFLNSELENQLTARFKKVLADDIYQKNKETGEFERVGTSSSEGDGGNIELPSWVQNNSALFDNSIKNTKIDIDGVEVNNENKGSFLSEDKLIFGEGDSNVELDKNTIITANKLRDIIGDNAAPDKMLLYDPISKDFGYKNQLVLPGYLEAAGVRFIEGNVTQKSSGTGSTYYNSASKKWVRINSALVTIGNALNDTYPDGNKQSIDIRDSGITFNKTLGQASSINFERAQTLTKFHMAADGEPTSEGKMIIFEPNTQTFKKAPIPSGSGEPLPNYIKPEIIEFSTEFQNHKISFNETSMVDKSGKNITLISSGQINVGRSDETDTSIDSGQSHISIDSTGKINFFNNSFGFTSLDYDKVKSLEQIKNSKIYSVDVPAYIPVGEASPRRIAWYGTSHFPRYREGDIQTGSVPIIEPNTEIPKYILNEGDSIEFRCLNPETSPQIYFNTWYVFCVAPELNASGPIEQINVEGYIGRQVDGNDTRVSIDIASTSDLGHIFPPGKIAFRITGYDITPQDPTNDPDEHPNPQPNPTPQSPIWKHRENVFRGTFRLKVISYTYASNPPAVQVNYAA